ncbi:MAG: TauD/TfdA family dioxygenase [Pseudomonadota bacterium]
MNAPQFTNIHSGLGSRVEGLDLGAVVDPPARAELVRKLAERKVLVFERQNLSAEQFHTFASGFGPLQVHVLVKYRHADYPGLSWLTNVASDGSVDKFGVTRATSWHSDGSYTHEPPAIGILYALEVPATGGGTLFADMCRAYEELSDVDREHVARLTGLHRHGAGPGGSMYDNSLSDDQAEAHEDAVHPAVVQHPTSGDHVLYVNTTHTRKFRELPQPDSEQLINRLVASATGPSDVYEHQWKVGDLLMWDQCATIHRGAGDYPPEQRRVKLRAIVQSIELS